VSGTFGALDLVQKIAAIQALRAVAANLVVVSHLSVIETKYSGGFVILPSLEGLGRFGVHIFFVISGFVMALLFLQKPNWRSFLWNRITRIYPIYWLYTLVVLTVAMIAPGAVNSSFDHQPSILKSLLLWPEAGLPWLAVGWSLIHEIYFYVVMTFLLLIRANLTFGLIAWAAVLALPIPHSSPALSLVLSPLTYEFIAGAFIALTVARFGGYSLPRYPFLERLGDASYSVYLSHVLLLSALGRMFRVLPWHGWIIETVFLLTCLVAANALFSYRFIERPIMRAARRPVTEPAARQLMKSETGLDGITSC
jgi:exopolysaccharide production protein ExoZ